MKVKLLINVEIARINRIFMFKPDSLILLINVKILTFVSRLNFMLRGVEHGKRFNTCTSRLWPSFTIFVLQTSFKNKMQSSRKVTHLIGQNK